MKPSFEKNDLSISVAEVDGFKKYVPMFHKHMEIVHVLKGEINVCIDGHEKTIKEGEVSITFPYVIHSYEEAKDSKAIILLFSPEVVALYDKDLLSVKPEYPYIKEGKRILPLINRLADCRKSDEKLAMAYLNVIIGEVFRSLKLIKTESMDLNSAQQVLVYCSEHYREDISVKKVAEALYLSESYITKIFSGKLGYSFCEYINTLRISEAKKLLKNTDKKIIEIMYACGFKNQSSFNRVFYGETGVTPKEYRQNSRN